MNLDDRRQSNNTSNTLLECFARRTNSDVSRQIVWRDIVKGFNMMSTTVKVDSSPVFVSTAPSKPVLPQLKDAYNPSLNPIPMEHAHVETIRRNPELYTVAEKTDGVRTLLWFGVRANTSGNKSKTDINRARMEVIDRDFNVYKVLLQSHKQVHKQWCNTAAAPLGLSTGSTTNQCWYLLDAEFVREFSTLNNYPSYLFLVFDVIIAEGNSVVDLPLNQRRAFVENLCASCPFTPLIQKRQDESTFCWRIDVKPIYPVTRLNTLYTELKSHYSNIKPIVTSGTRKIDHAIDGLIFTPALSGAGHLTNARDYYSFSNRSMLPILKYKFATTLDLLLCWNKQTAESGNENKWDIATLVTDDRFAKAYDQSNLQPLIALSDPQIDWRRTYHLPETPFLVHTDILLQYLSSQSNSTGHAVVECIVENIQQGRLCFKHARLDRNQPNSLTVCIKTLQNLTNPVTLERIVVL